MNVIFRLTEALRPSSVLLPIVGLLHVLWEGFKGRVGLGAMEKSHNLTDILYAHKKGKHVGISGIGGSSGSG